MSDEIHFFICKMLFPHKGTYPVVSQHRCYAKIIFWWNLISLAAPLERSCSTPVEKRRVRLLQYSTEHRESKHFHLRIKSYHQRKRSVLSHHKMLNRSFQQDSSLVERNHEGKCEYACLPEFLICLNCLKTSSSVWNGEYLSIISISIRCCKTKFT